MSSTQKKIRDLERLKKKLVDAGDTEKVTSIDVKISSLLVQKTENIANENKVKVQNKNNRRLKNPNPTKEKTPKKEVGVPGAFGNKANMKPKSDQPTEKASKKRSLDDSNSTDKAVSVNDSSIDKPVNHKANIRKIAKEIAAPDSSAVDSFFIDPKQVVGADGDLSEFHHKKIKKGEQLHISVEALARYSANGKYFHNHSMAKNNNFMSHVDTSKMNKQELRLHQWQVQQAEKKINQSAGLFGGLTDAQMNENSSNQEKSLDNRSARRQAGASAGNHTNTSRSYSAGNGNSGKYSSSNSSVGGTDRRKPDTSSYKPSSAPARDSRSSAGKPNASAAPAPHVGGEKTSATWMQGSGVSASAITENVKNKQKGMIVAAQGKKITFD